MIGVTYGLPRVRVISTLCHELFHAWLFLVRVSKLDTYEYNHRKSQRLSDLEEATCSWVSYKYVARLLKKKDTSDALFQDDTCVMTETAYLKYIKCLERDKASEYFKALNRLGSRKHVISALIHMSHHKRLDSLKH
eukprot:Blabericola_migrator_1__8222@NODE_4259_length_1255_cov_38_071549_g831_i1_p2_GENE_NODE_4259_length_1255_cov_38_071549_g831_i1NODE_4259_length_1255_cov_38_071549_g831_i1_p2_ORF_typecomplete_len136_score29_27DA1like/PF12315_8/1_9e10SprTlike/PF10263_9/0_0026SprTlike/PF10263_9/7e03Peptidase_M61/PF05299_12/0_011Cut8/PF08559_10/0_07_NODE_4259_length_1255_cov_38_071549_g831_i1324731